ncbi:hypothetical protein PHJA_000199500 [Phtheirospermum japonicum]|uniref:6,7-dimethyl-8-ribityllumazine synthase n=1 Tax=Phtheirospermum japonicum TaxID=374723 RepID=A0A830BES4_9LAMI|nr:hypothetical protein PHJA_000199500 [Phtheirospermum japonicum]
MGNSLRCCLACVLPCGALDLIRIVHLNGHVEELTGRVTAGEALKNYPNHVLTKPCSQGAGVARRILILSPGSELKRGSIYFLIPDSSLPAQEKSKTKKKSTSKQQQIIVSTTAEAEKKRRRRKVTVEDWRPHLESISEDL